MNSKYTEYIQNIVESLTDSEQHYFIENSRKNSDYISLFKKYVFSSKHGNLENELFEIKNERTLGAFNDLQSNLYENLIDFLILKEGSINSELISIKRIIDSAQALVNRKLFDNANDLLIKSFKLLKTISPDRKSYHLFIQYINLVLEVQSLFYDKKSSNLKVDFDELEMIEWLNRICYSAANGMIAKAKNIDEINFNQNVFFRLLNEYLIEQENYDALYHITQNLHPSSFLKALPSYKENTLSKKLKSSLYSFEILMILESLYSAIKLNDKEKADRQLNNLVSEIFSFRDSNYQVFAFILLHIQDLQIKMSIENAIPLPDNHLENQVKDLMLFTENEIENTSIRIEMNKGLIYFLNNNFSKSFKIFNSFNTSLNIRQEFKFYISIFELTSYLRLPIESFEYASVQRTIDFIKSLNFECTEYSNLILKHIKKYKHPREIFLNAIHFREENVPSTSYDKILDRWLLSGLEA